MGFVGWLGLGLCWLSVDKLVVLWITLWISCESVDFWGFGGWEIVDK